MADGALAKANQESAQRNAPEHTLRPGSVITALGSVRTKTEMVQKLKTETGLTAEVVRFSNFTARLVKIDKSSAERFGDSRSACDELVNFQLRYQRFLFRFVFFLSKTFREIILTLI